MGYLLAIEPKEQSCSENLFFFLGTESAILEMLPVANPSKWQQPFKEIWERLRVLETGPGCRALQLEHPRGITKGYRQPPRFCNNL